MVQSFLKKPGEVTGVFEDNALTLWVDTEMTRGILSKPDAAAKLEAAAAAFTGSPKRLTVRVGTPPAVPPETAGTASEKDPLDDLLALGRQYGNFTVT